MMPPLSSIAQAKNVFTTGLKFDLQRKSRYYKLTGRFLSDTANGLLPIWKLRATKPSDRCVRVRPDDLENVA